MAKLKKSQLKGIVKECLVEILAEGLENSAGSQLREAKVLSSPTARPRKSRARGTSDNPNFNKAVSKNVSALTDDPMMASLFEDTARGTYQDQLTNESAPGQVSMAETAAPGADLSQVFGDEAAQNWATLAFDSPSKKL